MNLWLKEDKNKYADNPFTTHKFKLFSFRSGDVLFRLRNKDLSKHTRKIKILKNN